MPKYPNLEAERARRNVTITMLADAMEVRINTVSDKMSGKIKSGFTFGEAVFIKKYLNDIMPLDMPLEELFEEVE